MVVGFRGLSPFRLDARASRRQLAWVPPGCRHTAQYEDRVGRSAVGKGNAGSSPSSTHRSYAAGDGRGTLHAPRDAWRDCGTQLAPSCAGIGERTGDRGRTRLRDRPSSRAINTDWCPRANAPGRRGTSPLDLATSARQGRQQPSRGPSVLASMSRARHDDSVATTRDLDAKGSYRISRSMYDAASASPHRR